MALNSVIFLLLTLTLFTGFTSTAQTPRQHTKTNSTHFESIVYERYAQQTLADATVRMQDIWNRRREIFLSISKERGYNVINRAPLKQEIENNYRKLVYTLASNLSTIPVAQLRDPVLRRRVKRLAKLQLYGLNKQEFDEARDLLHTMQTFSTSRMVCKIAQKGAEECPNSLAMEPSLVSVMRKTKRLEDLDYYWFEWRKATSKNDRSKATFIDYVRLMRVAATYNGHVTPSRTWYLYYDTDNFLQELENVVWEIMPLYEELHAYLRNSARSVYGSRLTNEDGGIPAPVMEQIREQAWYQKPIFRTPYPKNQLPTVQQRLEEILVTPVKINKKAAEFFESLGLNQMSDNFYEKFSRRIADEEIGSDCRSEVFYFPPDVALRYCPRLDYKKLLQMHGHMAELQYNLYRKELPYGVDSEPCPGFGAAIGEAAIVASGTPRHLNRLHILFNHSLTAEQSMNRLFRMGIHTILAVPQYFIIEKFLVDAMDGRIPVNEYNCAYWRLQLKYAGVIPPMRRSENHFDPDYKFYRGLNPEKPNTAKFLAEVLGHQFYRAFCLASGQYVPGDPEYPLHNCDFYGSTKAGDLMKKMMQLGATKHWRDVMEIATGERKLNGKGIMEYFAPLLTWLKEQNDAMDNEKGWDDDLSLCST